MKSVFVLTICLLTSLHAQVMSEVDAEEAKAMAELKAQEEAIAREQQKTIVPQEVKKSASVAVDVQPTTPAPAPAPPVVAQPNNLSRFISSLAWGKKDASTIYLSQTRYLLNRHFFERLGAEEGQVLRCPIKDHGFHFIDNRNFGLVLTNNRTKHVDLPPLSSLAAEARDYVLSLTQRENLEIHLWTRGYVITEAGTGLVLTVEIKD